MPTIEYYAKVKFVENGRSKSPGKYHLWQGEETFCGGRGAQGGHPPEERWRREARPLNEEKICTFCKRVEAGEPVLNLRGHNPDGWNAPLKALGVRYEKGRVYRVA